jgi:hypothetical protein
MAFLYGDASLSPLTSNFIAFLPDALELAVELLQADERILDGEVRARAHEEAATAELEKLAALEETVAAAVTSARNEETATGRCAGEIAHAAAELVRAERDRVQQALAADRHRIEGQATEARQACVRALQVLLAAHDPPETTTELRLQQQGGTRYQARLVAKTPWGLSAELDLEVPAAHALAHVLRVDKIVERLEVQAPEEGGWLRKEVKLRPQRLDKDFVTELVLAPEETTLRLRTAADGTGVGFDVMVRGSAVRVVRVGEDGLPPFELAEVDADRVVALKDKLATLCDDLKGRRRALVEARFGECAMDKIASPRVVVEQLVEAIAPIVQEIAKRSLAPTELVLKRLLSDGHREEIFVAKEQLRKRLERLSPPLLTLFAPLGLGDPSQTAAPAPAKPPAPAPKASRPPTLEIIPEDSAVISDKSDPSVTLDPGKI